MTTPTFTAGASLYKATSHYRSVPTQSRDGERSSVAQRPAAPPMAGLVSPAWYTPYSCRLNEETGVIECEEERPM